MAKFDKNTRILKLYEVLRNGKVVNKTLFSLECDISERTFDRDIDNIRLFLSEIFSATELLFDREKEGYRFSEKYSSELSVEEVLPMLKIMLDSGAFRSDEMQGMFDTLTSLIKPKNAAKINALLKEEMFGYQSPKHNKAILKIIWDLNESILRKTKIKLHCHTDENSESGIVLSPLSVVFIEGNFYLAAFTEDHADKYPAFFKIDEVESFDIINQPVHIRSMQIVDIAEIKIQLRKKINDKRG